ncbi:hypothetical protein AMAG_17987 [Allomyces macrogynus ATCC 38327]|uniref:Uncharacterized protein n=1 Tax=Allomyces macrogynus (strain ATCC 38327) TaxID=578462 RepID=A0A0L0S3N5_ALLM3|nr:hypothetical protein AMAG_17987 [Allomyces macrogynus ATCC 38327]|eukprot:KNE56984.1 hypothetical protein AMAG_17987 [Allomyces macrogynus ATCC 38327]
MLITPCRVSRFLLVIYAPTCSPARTTDGPTTACGCPHLDRDAATYSSIVAMHSARLQKSRRGIVEVESVENDIQLGEEFQDARCLTVAEVHHYLAERRKTRGGAGAGGADGGAYGAVPAASAGPVLQASDAQLRIWRCCA